MCVCMGSLFIYLPKLSTFVIVHISQMRKMRFIKTKQLAHSHLGNAEPAFEVGSLSKTSWAVNESGSL